MTKWQRQTVTDPAQNTWQYFYDDADRERQRTDPLGQSVYTTYYPTGLVKTITDRDGRQRTETYDDDERLMTDQWLNQDGVTIDDTLSYGYDDAGNQTTAADKSRHGDAGLRWRQPHQQPDRRVRHDADGRLRPSGNRNKVTDTLGGTTNVVSSVYDPGNRLMSRTLSLGGVNTVQVALGYTLRDELQTLTRSANVGGTLGGRLDHLRCTTMAVGLRTSPAKRGGGGPVGLQLHV